MNVVPFDARASAPPSRAAISTPPRPQRASASALWFALATFTIAASALPNFRPRIGGLALHPYLIVLVPLFPLVLSRLGSVDRRVLRGLAGFSALFFLSMLPAGLSVGTLVKMFAAVFTILAAVTIVRTSRDFVVVVLALVAAMLLISVRGIWLGFEDEEAGASGITVLKDIGNKNAFSLYGLPTLLLAGWVFTRMQTSLLERAVLAVGVVSTVVAMFATTNRSGWLGVALIAIMLTFGRVSLRSIMLLTAMAVAVYVLLGSVSGTRDMVERRISQTTGQNVSDDIRRDLLISSVRIGLENPLLGVSPQELPKQLARALRIRQPVVDPHNVYAYVLGGSGVFALAALFAWLWGFAFPSRRGGRVMAHQLCVMMVLLWIMRGGFTHEILFSPTFSIGLGLGPALVAIQQRVQQARAHAAAAQQARRTSRPPREGAASA